MQFPTGLSGDALLLLVATIGCAAFMLGRKSRSKDGSTARLPAVPPQDVFNQLPSRHQTEVDRLIADKKIIEAIKVLRVGGSLDLTTAKQVVDWRRAQRAPTPGT